MLRRIIWKEETKKKIFLQNIALAYRFISGIKSGFRLARSSWNLMEVINLCNLLETLQFNMRICRSKSHE